MAEKKLYVLALVFFGAVLFFGDAKYYLFALSMGGRLPGLVNVAGLALFFVFLCQMWLAARRSYGRVFAKDYSRKAFLATNIKANLPIVLPWITLSLVYDLLALSPLPWLKQLLESGWGDVLFFGLFLVFVIVFFPPLVRWLWGCTRLPDGPLKEHLLAFCRRQNFHAEIFIWPLFEGRVLTAGVMGLLPGLRYILLTPAIIETMSVAELEAVMAHEIGHVKKKHLLLYVLLIGGFSVVAGLLSEPILYYFLSTDWLYSLMARETLSPDTLLSLVSGLPLLVLLLVYFRFVFGYFIRNFERQADLYVFKVLGNSRALISAFDKITLTSGQSPEKKNWHHFGISERINQLKLCEREPRWIARQDRKVTRSLVAYVLILAAAVTLIQKVPTEQMARNYEGSYIEKVLMPQVKGIEDPAQWYLLLGDLLLGKKLEQRALVAYDKALQYGPDNPNVLNNLAWLLLTSEDPTLRDPTRALALARDAAQSLPHAHVLDTLAMAYWANGLVDDAISVEQRAMRSDPAQAEFYQQQLERFKTERYSPETGILN